MEEILEGILRFLGHIIRYFFFEIIFHFILFNLGRLFFLIITFGQYPRGIFLERHENRISLVGMLIVVVLWISIFFYNRYV